MLKGLMVAIVVDFKIEKETLGSVTHRFRGGMNSTKIFTLWTITMKMTIMKDASQEVKYGHKAPDL